MVSSNVASETCLFAAALNRQVWQGRDVSIISIIVLLHTCVALVLCCWTKLRPKSIKHAATSTEDDGNQVGKIFVSTGGLCYHYNRDCGAILNSVVVSKRPCLRCTIATTTA